MIPSKYLKISELKNAKCKREIKIKQKRKLE